MHINLKALYIYPCKESKGRIINVFKNFPVKKTIKGLIPTNTKEKKAQFSKYKILRYL